MHLEQELKNGDGGVLVKHASNQAEQGQNQGKTGTAADNRAMFSMSKSYSVEVSQSIILPTNSGIT